MYFRLEEFVVGIIVDSIEKNTMSLTILIQVGGQSTHSAIINLCEEILRNSVLNHPYSCNATTQDEVRHTLTANDKQVKTLLKSST
jgi:predicted NBD/HSP70 family sugar kinase